MVERIACFLTCGYTEAGTMQAFFRKINGKYDYKQFLPNKTIKKKGMAKNISNQISGLTGEKLLEKVYEILKNHKDEINDCKAIIIEDDLDGKFFEWSREKIQKYQQNIIHHIHQLLNNPLPVFIFYASPEAESWFIADWDNSFVHIYTNTARVPDVEKNACLFFIHHLRQYLANYVLKEYSTDIEKYGYFNGKYYKLSDQLIDAVQVKVKEYIQMLANVNDEYKQQIVHSKYLYYSKKLHGGEMMGNIKPEIIAAQCRSYFAPVYYALRDLQ